MGDIPDKCPYCGAELVERDRHGFAAYECSTECHSGRWARDDDCYLAEPDFLRAENARLRKWIPDPRQMSGWDDDGAPARVCSDLRELAELQGIAPDEMPEHIRTARKGGE